MILFFIWENIVIISGYKNLITSVIMLKSNNFQFLPLHLLLIQKDWLIPFRVKEIHIEIFIIFY